MALEIHGKRTEDELLGLAQPKRCVYVVDDDSDVRKSLHFLLTASSITTWPFAATPDFLEHLAELVPAPILLDYRMPGIDGLELLKILRARDVRWPVIVMTAHGDISVAVRAMKLGATEFLESRSSPARSTSRSRPRSTAWQRSRARKGTAMKRAA